MPTKHIPDNVWEEVEKVLVDAVTVTQKSVKESQIIELLLRVGLKHINEEDFNSLHRK